MVSRCPGPSANSVTSEPGPAGLSDATWDVMTRRTCPSVLLSQSPQQPFLSLPLTSGGHRLRTHVQEHSPCATRPRVSLPDPLLAEGAARTEKRAEPLCGRDPCL